MGGSINFTTCEAQGCSNRARWSPVLLMRPPGDLYHTPARGHLPSKYCEMCKASLEVGDILTDELWATICSNAAAAGRATPARELTEIDWFDFTAKRKERAGAH